MKTKLIIKGLSLFLLGSILLSTSSTSVASANVNTNNPESFQESYSSSYTCTVIKSGVYLRTGPGYDYGIIRGTSKGETFYADHNDIGWSSGWSFVTDTMGNVGYLPNDSFTTSGWG